MPLAHLLIPQITKRAEEIEAALGHRPQAIGYLNASAPTASDRALTELRAESPRPDTVMKNAARREVPRQAARKKVRPIPNAPSPQQAAGPAPGGKIPYAPDEPIGMTEGGRAIYASEPKPKPRKGKVVIKAQPGEAVGMNEQGQAIDIRGKSLGYLANQDPNVRTLERNRLDIPLVGEKNMYDQFGGQVLQQSFGEHLKAVQENRDANGYPTDQFPQGYFSGADPRLKERIELGVARLRELERGASI